MNQVWAALVIGAVALCAWLGKLDGASTALLDGAKNGFDVTLAIVPVMTLWLGMVAILDRGGATATLSRWLEPILRRLFKELPARHPAFAAMAMNVSANVLGLMNAATPLGLQAMRELKTANSDDKTASNAMVLFLVLNTSGVQIVPVTVITLRTTFNSASPGSVLIPTFVATLLSTIVAVLLCLWISRFFASSAPAPVVTPALTDAAPPVSAPAWRTALGWGAVVALAMVAWLRQPEPKANLSNGLIALLVVGIIVYGLVKKLPVYETAVEGGKQGPLVALRIVPYLIIMLAAVQVVRVAGLFDWLNGLVPENQWLPGSVLPQMMVRPLTSSGSLALLTDTLKNFGPDSYAGYVASILHGSSETTFYVLAVYYGSIGITRWRHTLLVCLLADVVSAVISVIVARVFY